MISRIGPRSPPNKWISSIITKPTCRTYPLVCHEREIPSHFSGVVMMISASRIVRVSGVLSPVNSTSLSPICRVSRAPQSLTRSRTRAFIGAIYTTFDPGFSRKAHHMASSQAIVFPDPVGEPRRTFADV